MGVLDAVCSNAEARSCLFWRNIQRIWGTLQNRYMWEQLSIPRGSSHSRDDMHKRYIKSAERIRRALSRNDPCFQNTCEVRLCACGSVEFKRRIGGKDAESFLGPCACEKPDWMPFPAPCPKEWFFWTLSKNCKSYPAVSSDLNFAALNVGRYVWMPLRSYSGMGTCICQLFKSITEAVLLLNLKWEVILDIPYADESMVLKLVSLFLSAECSRADICSTFSFRDMEAYVAKAVLIKKDMVFHGSSVKQGELERRIRVTIDGMWQCFALMHSMELCHKKEVLLQELHIIERMLRLLFPSLDDLELHHSEVKTMLEAASAYYEQLFRMSQPEPADFFYLRVLTGYYVERGSEDVPEVIEGNLASSILRCFL